MYSTQWWFSYRRIHNRRGGTKKLSPRFPPKILTCVVFLSHVIPSYPVHAHGTCPWMHSRLRLNVLAISWFTGTLRARFFKIFLVQLIRTDIWFAVTRGRRWKILRMASRISGMHETWGSGGCNCLSERRAEGSARGRIKRAWSILRMLYQNDFTRYGKLLFWSCPSVATFGFCIGHTIYDMVIHHT